MGSGSSSAALRGSCAGVDASGALPAAGGSSWWAALAVGGKLYGVPCNAERLLVYDPQDTAGPTGVDTRRIAEGPGKWRSAVALGGKIYGVPDRAEKLLVYEAATGKVAGVDTGRVARGSLKWQDAVALGGKVYGVPHHAEKLLVYNPATGQASGVPTAHVDAGPSKWVAGVCLDGKLYGVPFNAGNLLVYDPVSGKASGVSVSGVSKGQCKWISAVACGGKLYGIPCYADCILVYDPATGAASGVDTTAVATGPGKWVSAVAIGGKIYGVPDNADALLVFDPATRAVSGLDVSAIASGQHKWQCGLALGGRLYAAPHNADAVLVFDPATGEVSGVPSSSVAAGPKKWATAAVLGRSMLCLPYDAKSLLVHEPEGGQEDVEGTMEARDLPAAVGGRLLEDFVAAWLSEWIYQVTDVACPREVPPLTVDGKAVKFEVHQVHEDALQGSPARLGVVTAELPDRPAVLYLVFKGSSFLTDFVANASVSPDYTPFDRAFGDNTTFVHHGAHHAIAQLRVHMWKALCGQLEKADAAGTRRLIIAGHSLGGQYALAFLLQVFLDCKATSDASLRAAAPPLLADARAVSFGSPMCFGSAAGADVRRDLAQFMLERSVNYVNGGDPAPRLWSEMDLEAFMRYFVGWGQGHLSGMARRLVDYAAGPGGLAQRAQDLLQRPDIDGHLLRPARRYSHLSRMLVLGQEFRPWRPLSQESISIEDHSLVEGYIPNLRAAFDPYVAGGLYGEEGEALVDKEGRGLLV